MQTQYSNAFLEGNGYDRGNKMEDLLYPERLFQRMSPNTKWYEFSSHIEWLEKQLNP